MKQNAIILELAGIEDARQRRPSGLRGAPGYGADSLTIFGSEKPPAADFRQVLRLHAVTLLAYTF